MLRSGAAAVNTYNAKSPSPTLTLPFTKLTMESQYGIEEKT